MYRKSKTKIVCDALCGILMLVSILTYILIGVFGGHWAKTWVIILCTAVFCAVLEIAVNMFVSINNRKKEDLEKSDKE